MTVNISYTQLGYSSKNAFFTITTNQRLYKLQKSHLYHEGDLVKTQVHTSHNHDNNYCDYIVVVTE